MPRWTGKNWILWTVCALVCAWSFYAAWDTLAAWRSETGILQQAGAVIVALFPSLFVIPAALIIDRQPDNRIGRLLMLLVLVAVLSDAANRYLLSYRDVPPPATLPILLLMWFTNWFWLALLVLLMLILLRFPNGRPLSPRWRWVEYLAAAMFVFFLFIAADADYFGLGVYPWELPNPIGILPEAVIQVIMIPWMLMLAVLTMLSLASLFHRYRRMGEVGRAQMKWLLYACAIFGHAYLIFLAVNVINTPQGLRDFAYLLCMLAVITIPAAIGAAILRYRLFDIDVIIRMTLIYALVTGLLALAYTGGVVLFLQAFNLLTGQSSDLAIVMITLITAALFNPLRLRIQAVIDQRFYRQKYNTEQALAKFAAAARSGSDLEVLTGMLEELIRTNLQPTQVRLQLKSGAGSISNASTPAEERSAHAPFQEQQGQIG